MKKNLLSATAALLLFGAYFSPAEAQIKEPHAASVLNTISNSTARREDRKKIVAEGKSNELTASGDKATKKSTSDASAKISAVARTETDSVVAKTAPAKTAAAGTNAADSSAVLIDSSQLNARAADFVKMGAGATVLKVVPVATSKATVNSARALSSIYRVAASDTLDIRLLNSSSRASTLYTVLADGTIDYPLAGEPLNVGGLTPEEISTRLASRIKIYDQPQVSVGVRDYASHNVIVTGFVDNPGTKILRREAVPLYVLLTETPPRPEAAHASIVRAGTQIAKVDLTDQTQTAILVLPGDFIKVVAAPPRATQFYFIGGQIVTPGQRDFHAGLTLTQAILASGGTTNAAGNKAKLSRQGADKRLTTTEYNLKQIEEGKIPDPLLQPGDRLEVGRGHW